MQESEFTTVNKNPLTELSELRLEIKQVNQDFDLKCRLVFGKMNYHHEKRDYEVGVSRAYLRLLLEGCESKLNDVLGESKLEAIEEENCLVNQLSGGVALSAEASSEGEVKGAIGGNASISGSRKQELNQKVVHLPVSARPNDSWEIIPQAINDKRSRIIEGTAISNSHLCSVTRRQGGNRLAVVAELQISKMALKVSAVGGNRVGQTMSEWRNKDAIVSQILKKAIQRESPTNSPNQTPSTVTISRFEVSEK